MSKPSRTLLAPFVLYLACASTTPASEDTTTVAPGGSDVDDGAASDTTGGSSETSEAPSDPSDANVVQFTRSSYGLLFAEIEVEGEMVTAMVDFGDPHPFAISGTLARRLGIDLTKAGGTGMHVDGTTFDMYVGTAESITVGSHRLEQVEVRSGEGELEQVADTVGTPFDAVVGWGYVSGFNALLDYEASSLVLYADSLPQGNVTFSVEVDHDLYLRVPVRLDGQERKLIVDTGAPVSMIDTTAAKALGRSGPSTSLEISVGGHTQPQEFVVQDAAPLSQIGAVGILGGDFLAEWRVLFPVGERRIDFLARS